MLVAAKVATVVSAGMRMVPGVTRRGATLTRVDREDRSLVHGMIQVTLLRSCSVHAVHQSCSVSGASTVRVGLI